MFTQHRKNFINKVIDGFRFGDHLFWYLNHVFFNIRMSFDPAITNRLMIAWQQSYSQLRKGALKNIVQGDFNIPALKIHTEEGVRSFLSLTLYLQNYGIRTDVLRNMTLGELKAATKPAEKCIYCKETVRDYGDHKRHCVEREEWTFGQGPDQGGYTRENLGVEYQDYDSGSEIGKCPTWTIRVRRQKTRNNFRRL